MRAIPLTLLLTAALAMLAGCDDLRGTTGMVRLDGQPVEEGRIILRPVPPLKAKATSAEIVNGEFAVPASRGLPPGEYQAEITAMRKTGNKVKDSSGQLVDEKVQFLPPRYNTNTELTTTFDGATPLEFNLTLSP